jgi:hypothetical protein
MTATTNDVNERAFYLDWMRNLGIDPDGCGVEELSTRQLKTLAERINGAITRQIVKTATEIGNHAAAGR